MADLTVSNSVDTFMQAADQAAMRTALGIAFSQSGSAAIQQSGNFTLSFVGVANVVVTFPGSSGTLATLAGTENLTNKTLTSATLTTCSTGTAGLTFPGSTSGSVVLKAAAVAGSSTVTIPAGTDTLVTLTASQTLSGKTFIAPILGVATCTSLNGVQFTSAGALDLRTSSFTIIGNGDLTITLPGGGGSTVTFPASGVVYSTEANSITSAQLRSSLSDETGTGSAVFANTPTLVTPIIGAATGTSLTLSTFLSAEDGGFSGALTVQEGISTLEPLSYTDGDAISQSTSKSTSVTLNKPTGEITLNSASLNDNTNVSFTVANTFAKNPGCVIVNHVSAGTAGGYLVSANNIVDGVSFNITVRNVSGGTLSEAIVLQFIVLGGSNTP